jgi:predicted RNA polymerase sigma factor
MPTSRPRHVITETDAVAQALKAAAERWPEEGGNRSRLLLRLVMEGHRAAVDHNRRRLSERRHAVAATSGALTGMYAADYVAGLREDWPP